MQTTLHKLTRRAAWLLALVCLPAASLQAQDETLLLEEPTVHGDNIVFSYGGNLYMVGTTGGTAIQLTSHAGRETRPYFSPDGSQIAFTGQYDGNTDVFVMPATGGAPTRLTYHPSADLTEGWSPDGKILMRSTRTSATTRYSQLFELGMDGNLPAVLPMPYAERGSYNAQGTHMAYLQIREAWRSWKRYRGGQTDPIRIINLETLDTEEVPGSEVNNSYPVWLGNKVFFISDRDGIMNVYVYDTQSKQVSRVTNHDTYDVKYLSGNGDKLVYSQAGRIHVLDANSMQSTPVKIRVIGDRVERRPHWVDATDYMQGWDISPTGARALVAARGEIMTVPVEHGDVRNITNTPGAFERDPAWSPDGKHIAYFVVEGKGEYRLAVAPQDGRGEVKYYELDREPTYYYNPIWSPDSKHIAFTTKGKQSSNLRYVTLDGGKITMIDPDIMTPLNTGGMTVDWSPDSKWITYSRPTANALNSVFLFSVESGKTQQVSDDLADVGNPSFDADGKYIFFTASTNSGMSISGLDMSSRDQPVVHNIYGIVLSKETPSPFRPKSDEESTGEKEKPSASEGEGEGDEGMKVDMDGIRNRMVVLDLPTQRYFGLTASKDKIFVMTAGEGFGSTIHMYDLNSQKLSTYAEGSFGYVISADHKKAMVLYPGGRAVIASTAGKVDPRSGSLDKMRGAQVWVDPAQEWEQMYDEIWRVQRDFFYVPNMHGADWDAIREKYRPFFEHAPDRAAVNEIYAELIGELVIGHAYVGGGDTGEGADNVSTGTLGADYTIENGRYRITKIYDGESWNPDLRAPLSEPGVNVNEGDYILAIDGQQLNAGTNIYSLLQNKAGKQVSLLVNSSPSMDGAHEEVIVPVRSENALRSREWLEERRRYVAEKTNGRVGYVYMPNTGGEGYEYFRRYFYTQLDKEGMIIDERFNGGGHVADYVIDMLSRKTMNYWVPRTGPVYKSPFSSLDGPKVMILNEYAGSGGDYMPWAFREAGLGKLVGERSWGGLVGIAGSYALMDNGFITSPSFGILSTDGEWIIENVGTKPDIQVWQDPKKVANGEDPQLDAAIEQVMQELRSNPPAQPPAKPTGPNRVSY